MLLVVFIGCLCATQHHVGIGASYPFNSIQAAIDSASHGDSIFVHPGTYYGSLNINSKQLYISSLFSLTNNPADIENTILSGNYGIMKIEYGDSYGPGSLIGFTIRDARNDWQATLALNNYTLLNLEHCIITQNRKQRNSSHVEIGYGSVVTMKGCKIYENYSMSNAGLYKNNGASLTFDREVKNSIYNNYSSFASDIWYQHLENTGTVPLDTLFLAVSTSAVADTLFYRGINHIVADSVAGYTVSHDIYVAPWGDDSSDGASPQSPMRTLMRAARKAFPAPGQTQTIHVASGTYAFNDYDDMNIGVRCNVSIIGNANDMPIFDAQGSMFLISYQGNGDMHIENIVLKNASYSALSRYNVMPIGGIYTSGNLLLKNLRFIDNGHDFQPRFFETAVLKNIISTCNPGVDTGNSFNFACRNVHIENSVFAYRRDSSGVRVGGGLSFSRSTQNIPGPFTANIINTLFHDLNAYSLYYGDLGIAVSASAGVHINLINSMIIDNQSPNSTYGAICIADSSSVSLYNSIVWNNRPYNISMWNPNTHLESYYSLIENAAQTYIYPHWLLNDGNIVYGDSNLPVGSIPMYAGIGPYKYMPSAGSCTIDSGNLALPEGVVIPEYDLAGNPRVYGAGIDLGPYEWQGLEFDFCFSQTDHVVSFFPISNVEIFEIHWDFDMDGIIDSNELSPTYQYPANGTFSVGCYINGGLAGKVFPNAITISTQNADENQTTSQLSIQNLPNPFSTFTNINVAALNTNERGAKIHSASVAVYNIKGQLVKSIKLDPYKADAQLTHWDGRDQDNQLCGSGIYFLRLMLNGKSEANRKVTLIR